MSIDNLEDFTRAFDRMKKPEEVDAFFAKMQTVMPQADFKQAVDDIERSFVGQVKHARPSPSERRIIQNRIKILEHLRDASVKDAENSDFYINMRTYVAGNAKEKAILMAQVFINIHKEKGDKADSVVHIFIEEMNKIPQDARNQVLGWMNFKLGLYDRIAALSSPPAPPRPPGQKPE